MPYNETLADRVRFALKEKRQEYLEKPMMGGLVFMVDDKMCLGIVKDDLMARIDPEVQEASLARRGAREMDFTHQRMKGYLFVNLEGTDMDSDLEYWIDLALAFNPKARSSKK